MSYPSKPTGFDLRWATGGGADVVEPISGDKDVGWVDAEEPPAEYMNWLQKGAYLWQTYFEGTTDELKAVTLRKDGTVGLTGILQPAVTNTQDIGTNTHKFKDAIFAGTVYANGVDIADLALSGDAYLGANAFVTNNITAGGNATVTGVTQSVGGFAPTDSDTVSTPPPPNTLRKRLVPKAWANITTTGSTPGERGGANVGSIGLSGTYVRVVFATPFADTGYAVTLSVLGAAALASVVTKHTNYMDIGLFTLAGSPLTVVSADVDFDFVVFGSQ